MYLVSLARTRPCAHTGIPMRLGWDLAPSMVENNMTIMVCNAFHEPCRTATCCDVVVIGYPVTFQEGRKEAPSLQLPLKRVRKGRREARGANRA